MHQSPVIHVRDDQIEPLLHKPISTYTLVIFVLAEHVESEVDDAKLVFLLVGHHHHMQSRIQQHYLLLLFSLLVIEMIIAEIVVNSKE